MGINRFSALQRAENSSIRRRTRLLFTRAGVSVLFSEPKIPQSTLGVRWSPRGLVFQCSSASRKFLNGTDAIRAAAAISGFSALQRAENSSIQLVARVIQFNHQVSVLFSEPKIPQLTQPPPASATVNVFQCSSASRKFLNRNHTEHTARTVRFQCSSASRKFLNLSSVSTSTIRLIVSVLFSEPKIPQSAGIGR